VHLFAGLADLRRLHFLIHKSNRSHRTGD
jgi:hypothetical protein